MCILLEFGYAKFDVSSLFLLKVIEEKPLEGVDRGFTAKINLSLFRPW